MSRRRAKSALNAGSEKIAQGIRREFWDRDHQALSVGFTHLACSRQAHELSRCGCIRWLAKRIDRLTATSLDSQN